jgi:hypothetical protein
MSLLKIISLTMENSPGKMALYFCMPILIVLYINDTFKMMLYYWGFPAFRMTQPVLILPNPDATDFIETDAHC